MASSGRVWKVRKRFETENGVEFAYQSEQLRDLVLNLVGTHIEMRIVHAKLPHTEHAVEGAGELVAVIGAKLRVPKGKSR
jgi:hypothetical protein